MIHSTETESSIERDWDTSKTGSSIERDWDTSKTESSIERDWDTSKFGSFYKIDWAAEGSLNKVNETLNYPNSITVIGILLVKNCFLYKLLNFDFENVILCLPETLFH